MAIREVYFSDGGIAETGLSPVFDTLKKVSDGSNVTPPAISEIGGGWYKFDINPTEKLVGVIDGTASVVNGFERFVPVFFDQFDFLFEVLLTLVFDEDSDSITFLAFIHKNGQRQTGATLCEIEVFNSAHVSQFSISSSSITNGVFVLTKSTPGIVKNNVYYAVAKITLSGVVHESLDTYISIE